MPQTLRNMLKTWVVNDYFTPNVKAEVILDALLSPYIAELIPGAKLVTKEMSIPDGERFGSLGPKIDYVLADPEKVYLVELKTTKSSLNDTQIEQYLKYCQGKDFQGKDFGKTLGRQLLTLLDNPKRTFVLHLEDKGRWGDLETWNDQTAGAVFDAIINKKQFRMDADREPSGPDPEDKGYYAKTARALIQKNGWAQRDRYRSRKYLYTLGQLLDYRKENGDDLWGKRMEVIYLEPDGDAVKGRDGELRSFSLQAFTADLCKRHPEDDYAQMLAEIVSEILWRDQADKG